MRTKTLRIGVIGLGAIGPSQIFAIEKARGCELAAVCDVREDVARKAGEEKGVPFFTNPADLAACKDIDAVTVCTPSGYHLDSALPAIEAGKHALVEKPLEITTERVDRLIGAARERGVKLAGVYQSRFREVSRRMKTLFDEGLLGTVYSGSAYTKLYRSQAYYDSGGWRGTWKVDGGGCLMNQGIHLVDLFLWFMGDVESLCACVDTRGRENVEVETLALSMLSFKSGARGCIEATTLDYADRVRHIHVFGSRGSVAFSSGKIMHLELIDPSPAESALRDELLRDQAAGKLAAERTIRKKAPPGTAIPQVDMGHTPVVQDFVDAIHEDRESMIPGEEARRAVSVINAIYESGRSGGARVHPA